MAEQRTLALTLGLLASLFCAVFSIPTLARDDADSGNGDIYTQLKEMSLEDLMEVETRLDEVFDVFDGLVKRRQVKVATGDTQSAARAPAVTSVITAQDIEAMGASELDEVLETVPGLHVARSQFFYDPVYTMRGIYSVYNPEVLVMVNDIPINLLYTGSRSMVWGGFPLHDVARIEVIRGPGSAVYGADAYAGVINIITRDAGEIDGTEVGARGGGFDSGETWVLHGGEYHGWKLAGSFQYFTTTGHDEIVAHDDQTNLDQRFGSDASLAPGPMNLEREGVDLRMDVQKDKWRLRAGYQGRDKVGMGPNPSQTLDRDGNLRDDRINADITWHDPNFTRSWDVTAQASYLDTHLATTEDRRLYPRGTVRQRPDGSRVVFPNGIIINPGVAERHTRAGVSGFYSGFRRHLIRMGLGYHYADLYEVTMQTNNGINPATGRPIPPGSPPIDLSDTPYVFMQEGARSNWHVFLQDSWNFAAHWELTAGLRYDHYSDFGATTNPRLALVHGITDDMTAKLLYGRAFRAPAFRELYALNNPVSQGNPDLEPETIETWELAFDWRIKENLHLASNLFYYQTKNKILFVPDPGFSSNTARNAGSQKGHGLELEARWKATARLSLLTNYAYQKSTDDTHDADAGNAPTHQIYVRGDWLVRPDWYLNTQVNWVGERNRVYNDPREPLDGYTTVDMTLRYKKNQEKGWNVALGVRNLFDAEAFEPSEGPGPDGRLRIPGDYPLAGRNWFLEARYRF